jgi:hypothetical protein
MKKPWLLALLALAVAALSVFFVWVVLVTYVMRSLPSAIETAMTVSLVIIAAAMCAAVVFALRQEGGRIYRAALLVMLLAGLTPAAVSWTHATIEDANRKIEDANKKAEQEAFEAKFLSQLETYRKDVAERIAAKNPYAPREAQEFLQFVQGSDLRYRSLPDYSPQTFPLLKQTLDGKVLDPNARVKGPTRVDVNEEPLFVVYYNFYLKTGVELKRVREREWKLLQLLVAGGANLADPAATGLKDHVKRETAPYDANVPEYITLK